jgi:hypothetical protein
MGREFLWQKSVADAVQRQKMPRHGGVAFELLP